MAGNTTLRGLETQVSAVQARIAKLEARREEILGEAAAIEDEIASLRGTRGPGRPRKRRGRPGRPAGVAESERRRGTGRRPTPRGSGLTDFIRARVARRAQSVARLAAMASKSGFRSRNLAQVIRLMVGKAADLVRNADDRISSKGRPGRPKRSAAKGRPVRRRPQKRSR